MKTVFQLLLLVLVGSSRTFGANYSLDLSTVTQRQHMQDWDPAWISELEDWFQGFEFQVDPGNGGQVSTWTGDGNPATYVGTNIDYSQFTAAGPPSGHPVRVRMKYEHRDNGTWISCSHGNDSDDRQHYAVALQNRQLRIYKFWGGSASGYAIVARIDYTPADGGVYWIHLTEVRENDDPNGNVTISGELWNADSTIQLAAVSVTDTGNFSTPQVAGKPVVPSSNRRGFGSYFEPDGNGTKIFEWHVEGLVTPLDYSSWQATTFPEGTPPDDRLDSADPDEDGLPNAVEFYLGLSPLIADPPPWSVRLSDGNFIVSYSRKKERLVTVAEIQQSINLRDWSAATGVEAVIGSVGDVEEVEVAFPIVAQGFVRFAVQP